MGWATAAQIKYIEILMDELDYDEDDLKIDLNNIEFEEADQLIKDLKDELGWN